MSFKRRASILSVSAAAAAMLIPVSATAGVASAATTSGRGGSAAVVLPTVRENVSGTGLVLVPVPGVAQTTKVYDGLTATSPTARQVPDSDGSHPAVAGRAVAPATEPTAYVETGPFNVYNKDNDACLDADSTDIANNGTKVQLWTCIAGEKNQFWYEDNYGSYARIWNEDGGRYLDADSTAIGNNGTKVQLWTYIDGETNQWWYVNGDGTITNQDPNAGIHDELDADTGTINSNGTKIQLWQFLGGVNQYWY